MSRQEQTFEQDWGDSFLFLQGSRGAPFLIILPHACSPRKLKKMLMEWLPPHWWLTPDERQAMRQFWERWYKDRFKGGTADFLVRAAVTNVCDDLGLRKHYLDRIVPTNKQTVNGFGFTHQARSLEMYKVIHKGPVGDRLRVRISGQDAWLNCYRTNGEYGEPEWYVCINLRSKVSLTESVARTLSQCEVALLNASGDYYHDEVIIVFNSDAMDQLTVWAEGKQHGWSPWDILLPQDGFLPALIEELKAKGLQDFTILEAS